MRGCSPEVASRIVGLLMADVGIGCVYSPTPLAPPAPPAPPEPVHLATRRRVRKVTPEIAAFLRSANGIPMADILTQVQQRFGVQLSSGSVYKEWQSAHLARAQGTPTPAPGAFS